ncbi:Piso0_003899 [Millerozyma farinosa CBS 7064]|uniref:Piso0_003899 protein n=1 Tax=Pichia sorbitophila (strain ATCC MYA-4447 / BCRC 22081 / CBS 7064 / NBRC 10061 / NRRL Y-12695) TaxID=559304 RepID=G8Y6X5_PICSO|nr:Piso0_003899 [Millerozyma farinosa CBS 7064]CCE84355.1 Piso0_003899 [Millerozyma farinosa CBS 7064]
MLHGPLASMRRILARQEPMAEDKPSWMGDMGGQGVAHMSLSIVPYPSMGGGFPSTSDRAFKRLVCHISHSSITAHVTCASNAGLFRLRLDTRRDVDAHTCIRLFMFPRLRSMDLKRCFAL